jgi:hypothetical protein
MTKYEELQSEHQQLLKRSEAERDSDELLGAVRAYIERARVEAEAIPAPRDRDQLRANLRFWASFVYEKSGTYPETALRPASGQAPAPTPAPSAWHKQWWVWGLVAVLVLLVAYTLSGTGLYGAAGPAALTDTPHPPTSTPVPTFTAIPTITPSYTPIKPATSIPVSPVFTPSSTSTRLPVVFTPTPEPGAGGNGYTRKQLVAVVSAQPNPNGCAKNLNLSFDRAGKAATEKLGVVQLSQVGSGKVASTSRLSRDATRLSLDLGAAESNQAYLVQIDHPDLTVSNVIVQFTNDCEQSQVNVSYVVQDAPSLLAAEPPRNPNLLLDWRLVMWGPSPFGSTWVAQLTLQAKGGSGQYIFWADGKRLPDNQLMVEGQPCQAAHSLVGVTSGGESALRELALQAPYCPK